MDMRMIKGIFLKAFIEKFPAYAHRMRNTMHSFGDDSLSPHHLEDDCWSHTMMVFSSLDISGLSRTETAACMMAALVHDCGKPFVRKSHKPGKINFWGHGEAGVQLATEMCYELFGSQEDFIQILRMVVHCVSNHIEAYAKKTEEEFIKLSNRDPILLKILSRLLRADLNGQISSLPSEDKCDSPIVELIRRTDDNLKYHESASSDVVMICGIPACGKDYFAASLNHKIISLDNARIQAFTEKNPNHGFTKAELYDKAFVYCRNKDLTSYIKRDLEEAKESGLLTPALCNVHNTTKARKRSMEVIRKVYGDSVNVECIYILTTRKAARINNVVRTDHILDNEVIERFSFNQNIPTMAEGFSRVNVWFNTYNVE